MISIKYGEMPSFDDFVNQLKTYTDNENELVAGNPPEVFWMEIPIDSSDYMACVNLYESLPSDVQEQIHTDTSNVDQESEAIIFTTYESLYEFLNIASQQWDYPDSMELWATIMNTFGYDLI